MKNGNQNKNVEKEKIIDLKGELTKEELEELIKEIKNKRKAMKEILT
jgi:ABC-type transporter Mla MlaB component